MQSICFPGLSRIGCAFSTSLTPSPNAQMGTHFVAVTTLFRDINNPGVFCLTSEGNKAEIALYKLNKLNYTEPNMMARIKCVSTLKNFYTYNQTDLLLIKPRHLFS